jgi:hypothetical protein
VDELGLSQAATPKTAAAPRDETMCLNFI